MSKYADIWKALKQADVAEVTVSKDAVQLVIWGVKKIKSQENTARRRMGLIGWSKLIITTKQLSATMVKITFTFCYSTKL